MGYGRWSMADGPWLGFRLRFAYASGLWAMANGRWLMADGPWLGFRLRFA
jgi:hypothetical protein